MTIEIGNGTIEKCGAVIGTEISDWPVGTTLQVTGALMGDAVFSKTTEQLRITPTGEVLVREGEELMPIGLNVRPSPRPNMGGLIDIAVALARAYKQLKELYDRHD